MTVLSFHDREHETRDGMIYMSVRAISAIINLNYDGWPAEELKKAYKTFINGPIFIDHDAADIKRTRGRIIDAEYIETEDDQWIELLLEIDAESFPLLAKHLLNGDLDSVSMGANVGEAECSICGNLAYSNADLCQHALTMKGQVVNGELAYEICRDITFDEISLVFEPADSTALAKKIVHANKKQATTWTYTPESHLIDINEYTENVDEEPAIVYPLSFSNEADPALEDLFQVNPYAIVGDLL